MSDNIMLQRSGIALDHVDLADMPDTSGINSDHDARYGWLLPPIEDFFDPTGGLPTDPEVGDRYGSDATANGWIEDNIYEWDGSEWIETEPDEGMLLWEIFGLIMWVFFSGGWREVNAHENLEDMPSATNTDHDGRYYTETEIDATFVPYTGANANVDLGTFDLTIGNNFTMGDAVSADNSVMNFLSSGNNGIITFDQSENAFNIGSSDISTTGGYFGEFLSGSLLVLNSAGDMFFNSCDDFIFRDADAALAVRLTIESATGNIITAGTVTAGAFIGGTFAGSSGTFQGKVIIDLTDTEALLVRKNGDTGDVFTVDTTNSRVVIGGDLAGTPAANIGLLTLAMTDTDTRGFTLYQQSANSQALNAKSFWIFKQANGTRDSAISMSGLTNELHYDNDLTGFVGGAIIETYAPMSNILITSGIDDATGVGAYFRTIDGLKNQLTIRGTNKISTAPGFNSLIITGQNNTIIADMDIDVAGTVFESSATGLDNQVTFSGQETDGLLFGTVIGMRIGVRNQTNPTNGRVDVYGIQLDEVDNNDPQGAHWGIYDVSSADWILKGDGKSLLFGAASAGDVGISFTDDALDIKLDVTGVNDLTIGDGGTTNYSKFEPDGTLEFVGAATVFKDINLGAAVLTRPAATAPDEVNFVDEVGGDTGIASLGFAVGEKVGGNFEIQHDYKEGSDLFFHIHWQGVAIPTGTDKVKWQLEYTVSQSETTLNAVTTIVIEEDFDTQYEFKNTAFVAITGTDFNIEDQFLFTLTRIGASADEYGGDAILATIGIHYEVDTVGSRQILIK